MLFKHTDPRQYAALRIAFGMLTFFSLISLANEINFNFSDFGWLSGMQSRLSQNWCDWSLLYYVTEPDSVRIFFLATAISAIFFALGFFTIFSNFILFIGFVSINNRNPLLTYGGDIVIRLVLFYLFFAPTGAAWSIDQKLRRLWNGKSKPQLQLQLHLQLQNQPSEITSEIWPLRMIQIQICLIYFWAGLTKLGGISWWDGTAIPITLLNPAQTYWDLTKVLKHNGAIEFLFRTLTRIILIWEILFPLTVYWHKSRWFALSIGVMMHLSIIVLAKVNLFGYIMIASYLAFLPSSFFQKWPRQSQI